MLAIGQNYQFGDHQLTITKNLLTEPHHSHEVYLAIDQTQQSCVIKFATTPLAVEQLQHEQAIIQELRHVAGIPQTLGLVRIHDPIHTHLLAAHLTKYIPHKYTLTHYLEFNPTLVRQAKLLPTICTWFKQCVDIMVTVHEQGIAHGDLKLQNGLLDAAGQIHIIDWDHGQWFKQASQPARIEGTPPYMSPEQLRGQTPDPQTDMYTLGMMFIALAYGSVVTPLYAWSRPKSKRRDKAAVGRAIMNGETAKYFLFPLPRTALEMHLQMIWRYMTQSSREHRFLTMRAIQTALAEI